MSGTRDRVVLGREYSPCYKEVYEISGKSFAKVSDDKVWKNFMGTDQQMLFIKDADSKYIQVANTTLYKEKPIPKHASVDNRSADPTNGSQCGVDNRSMDQKKQLDSRLPNKKNGNKNDENKQPRKIEDKKKKNSQDDRRDIPQKTDCCTIRGSLECIQKAVREYGSELSKIPETKQQKKLLNKILGNDKTQKEVSHKFCDKDCDQKHVHVCKQSCRIKHLHHKIQLKKQPTEIPINRREEDGPVLSDPTELVGTDDYALTNLDQQQQFTHDGKIYNAELIMVLPRAVFVPGGQGKPKPQPVMVFVSCVPMESLPKDRKFYVKDTPLAKATTNQVIKHPTGTFQTTYYVHTSGKNAGRIGQCIFGNVEIKEARYVRDTEFFPTKAAAFLHLLRRETMSLNADMVNREGVVYTQNFSDLPPDIPLKGLDEEVMKNVYQETNVPDAYISPHILSEKCLANYEDTEATRERQRVLANKDYVSVAHAWGYPNDERQPLNQIPQGQQQSPRPRQGYNINEAGGIQENGNVPTTRIHGPPGHVLQKQQPLPQRVPGRGRSQQRGRSQRGRSQGPSGRARGEYEWDGYSPTVGMIANNRAKQNAKTGATIATNIVDSIAAKLKEEKAQKAKAEQQDADGYTTVTGKKSKKEYGYGTGGVKTTAKKTVNKWPEPTGGWPSGGLVDHPKPWTDAEWLLYYNLHKVNIEKRRALLVEKGKRKAPQAVENSPTNNIEGLPLNNPNVETKIVGNVPHVDSAPPLDEVEDDEVEEESTEPPKILIGRDDIPLDDDPDKERKETELSLDPVLKHLDQSTHALVEHNGRTYLVLRHNNQQMVEKDPRSNPMPISDLQGMGELVYDVQLSKSYKGTYPQCDRAVGATIVNTSGVPGACECKQPFIAVVRHVYFDDGKFRRRAPETFVFYKYDGKNQVGFTTFWLDNQVMEKFFDDDKSGTCPSCGKRPSCFEDRPDIVLIPVQMFVKKSYKLDFNDQKVLEVPAGTFTYKPIPMGPAPKEGAAMFVSTQFQGYEQSDYTKIPLIEPVWWDRSEFVQLPSTHGSCTGILMIDGFIVAFLIRGIILRVLVNGKVQKAYDATQSGFTYLAKYSTSYSKFIEQTPPQDSTIVLHGERSDAEETEEDSRVAKMLENEVCAKELEREKLDEAIAYEMMYKPRSRHLRNRSIPISDHIPRKRKRRQTEYDSDAPVSPMANAVNDDVGEGVIEPSAEQENDDHNYSAYDAAFPYGDVDGVGIIGPTEMTPILQRRATQAWKVIEEERAMKEDHAKRQQADSTIKGYKEQASNIPKGSLDRMIDRAMSCNGIAVTNGTHEKIKYRKLNDSEERLNRVVSDAIKVADDVITQHKRARQPICTQQRVKNIVDDYLLEKEKRDVEIVHDSIEMMKEEMAEMLDDVRQDLDDVRTKMTGLCDDIRILTELSIKKHDESPENEAARLTHLKEHPNCATCNHGKAIEQQHQLVCTCVPILNDSRMEQYKQLVCTCEPMSDESQTVNRQMEAMKVAQEMKEYDPEQDGPPDPNTPADCGHEPRHPECLTCDLKGFTENEQEFFNSIPSGHQRLPIRRPIVQANPTGKISVLSQELVTHGPSDDEDGVEYYDSNDEEEGREEILAQEIKLPSQYQDDPPYVQKAALISAINSAYWKAKKLCNTKEEHAEASQRRKENRAMLKEYDSFGAYLEKNPDHEPKRNWNYAKDSNGEYTWRLLKKLRCKQTHTCPNCATVFAEGKIVFKDGDSQKFTKAKKKKDAKSIVTPDKTDAQDELEEFVARKQRETTPTPEQITVSTRRKTKGRRTERFASRGNFHFVHCKCTECMNTPLQVVDGDVTILKSGIVNHSRFGKKKEKPTELGMKDVQSVVNLFATDECRDKEEAKYRIAAASLASEHFRKKKFSAITKLDAFNKATELQLRETEDEINSICFDPNVQRKVFDKITSEKQGDVEEKPRSMLPKCIKYYSDVNWIMMQLLDNVKDKADKKIIDALGVEAESVINYCRDASRIVRQRNNIDQLRTYGVIGNIVTKLRVIAIDTTEAVKEPIYCCIDELNNYIQEELHHVKLTEDSSDDDEELIDWDELNVDLVIKLDGIVWEIGTEAIKSIQKEKFWGLEKTLPPNIHITNHGNPFTIKSRNKDALKAFRQQVMDGTLGVNIRKYLINDVLKSAPKCDDVTLGLGIDQEQYLALLSDIDAKMEEAKHEKPLNTEDANDESKGDKPREDHASDQKTTQEVECQFAIRKDVSGIVIHPILKRTVSICEGEQLAKRDVGEQQSQETKKDEKAPLKLDLTKCVDQEEAIKKDSEVVSQTHQDEEKERSDWLQYEDAKEDSSKVEECDGDEDGVIEPEIQAQVIENQKCDDDAENANSEGSSVEFAHEVPYEEEEQERKQVYDQDSQDELDDTQNEDDLTYECTCIKSNENPRRKMRRSRPREDKEEEVDQRPRKRTDSLSERRNVGLKIKPIDSGKMRPSTPNQQDEELKLIPLVTDQGIIHHALCKCKQCQDDEQQELTDGIVLSSTTVNHDSEGNGICVIEKTVTFPIDFGVKDGHYVKENYDKLGENQVRLEVHLFLGDDRWKAGEAVMASTLTTAKYEAFKSEMPEGVTVKSAIPLIFEVRNVYALQRLKDVVKDGTLFQKFRKYVFDETIWNVAKNYEKSLCIMYVYDDELLNAVQQRIMNNEKAARCDHILYARKRGETQHFVLCKCAECECQDVQEIECQGILGYDDVMYSNEQQEQEDEQVQFSEEEEERENYLIESGLMKPKAVEELSGQFEYEGETPDTKYAPMPKGGLWQSFFKPKEEEQKEPTEEPMKETFWNQWFKPKPNPDVQFNNHTFGNQGYQDAVDEERRREFAKQRNKRRNAGVDGLESLIFSVFIAVLCIGLFSLLTLMVKLPGADALKPPRCQSILSVYDYEMDAQFGYRDRRPYAQLHREWSKPTYADTIVMHIRHGTVYTKQCLSQKFIIPELSKRFKQVCKPDVLILAIYANPTRVAKFEPELPQHTAQVLNNNYMYLKTIIPPKETDAVGYYILCRKCIMDLDLCQNNEIHQPEGHDNDLDPGITSMHSNLHNASSEYLDIGEYIAYPIAEYMDERSHSIDLPISTVVDKHSNTGKMKYLASAEPDICDEYQSCHEDYKCCFGPPWICCPRGATCCGDGTCCDEGMICKMDDISCQDPNTGEYKPHSTIILPQFTETEICYENSCSDEQTCCVYKKTAHCCPMKNALCCGDGNCCPKQYWCQQGKCKTATNVISGMKLLGIGDVSHRPTNQARVATYSCNTITDQGTKYARMVWNANETTWPTFTADSYYGNTDNKRYAPECANVFNKKGDCERCRHWGPLKDGTSAWLKIVFNKIVVLDFFTMYKNLNNDEYVTKFKVATDDVYIYEIIEAAYKFKHTFGSPKTVKSIKFAYTSVGYHEWPVIGVLMYGWNLTFDHVYADSIRVHKYSASSHKNSTTVPKAANPKATINGGINKIAWIPRDNDSHPFLQLDLGSAYYISHVIALSAYYSSDRVTNYSISISYDGKHWVKNGTASANTYHEHYDETKLGMRYARYIRFHPKAHIRSRAMRVMPFGEKPVGLKNSTAHYIFSSNMNYTRGNTINITIPINATVMKKKVNKKLVGINVTGWVSAYLLQLNGLHEYIVEGNKMFYFNKTNVTTITIKPLARHVVLPTRVPSIATSRSTTPVTDVATLGQLTTDVKTTQSTRVPSSQPTVSVTVAPTIATVAKPTTVPITQPITVTQPSATTKPVDATLPHTTEQTIAPTLPFCGIELTTRYVADDACLGVGDDYSGISLSVVNGSNSIFNITTYSDAVVIRKSFTLQVGHAVAKKCFNQTYIYKVCIKAIDHEQNRTVALNMYTQELKSPKIVYFALKFDISYEEVLKNEAAFVDAFKKALADKLGIGTDDISITGIKKGSVIVMGIASGSKEIESSSVCLNFEGKKHCAAVETSKIHSSNGCHRLSRNMDNDTFYEHVIFSQMQYFIINVCDYQETKCIKQYGKPCGGTNLYIDLCTSIFPTICSTMVYNMSTQDTIGIVVKDDVLTARMRCDSCSVNYTFYAPIKLVHPSYPLPPTPLDYTLVMPKNVDTRNFTQRFDYWMNKTNIHVVEYSLTDRFFHLKFANTNVSRKFVKALERGICYLLDDFCMTPLWYYDLNYFYVTPDQNHEFILQTHAVGPNGYKYTDYGYVTEDCIQRRNQTLCGYEAYHLLKLKFKSLNHEQAEQYYQYGGKSYEHYKISLEGYDDVMFTIDPIGGSEPVVCGRPRKHYMHDYAYYYDFELHGTYDDLDFKLGGEMKCKLNVSNNGTTNCTWITTKPYHVNYPSGRWACFKYITPSPTSYVTDDILTVPYGAYETFILYDILYPGNQRIIIIQHQVLPKIMKEQDVHTWKRIKTGHEDCNGDPCGNALVATNETHEIEPIKDQIRIRTKRSFNVTVIDGKTANTVVCIPFEEHCILTLGKFNGEFKARKISLLIEGQKHTFVYYAGYCKPYSGDWLDKPRSYYCRSPFFYIATSISIAFICMILIMMLMPAATLFKKVVECLSNVMGCFTCYGCRTRLPRKEEIVMALITFFMIIGKGATCPNYVYADTGYDVIYTNPETPTYDAPTIYQYSICKKDWNGTEGIGKKGNHSILEYHLDGLECLACMNWKIYAGSLIMRPLNMANIALQLYYGMNPVVAYYRISSAKSIVYGNDVYIKNERGKWCYRSGRMEFSNGNCAEPMMRFKKPYDKSFTLVQNKLNRSESFKIFGNLLQHTIENREDQAYRLLFHSSFRRYDIYVKPRPYFKEILYVRGGQERLHVPTRRRECESKGSKLLEDKYHKMRRPCGTDEVMVRAQTFRVVVDMTKICYKFLGCHYDKRLVVNIHLQPYVTNDFAITKFFIKNRQTKLSRYVHCNITQSPCSFEVILQSGQNDIVITNQYQTEIVLVWRDSLIRSYMWPFLAIMSVLSTFIVMAIAFKCWGRKSSVAVIPMVSAMLDTGIYGKLEPWHFVWPSLTIIAIGIVLFILVCKYRRRSSYVMALVMVVPFILSVADGASTKAQMKPYHEIQIGHQTKQPFMVNVQTITCAPNDPKCELTSHCQKDPSCHKFFYIAVISAVMFTLACLIMRRSIFDTKIMALAYNEGANLFRLTLKYDWKSTSICVVVGTLCMITPAKAFITDFVYCYCASYAATIISLPIYMIYLGINYIIPRYWYSLVTATKKPTNPQWENFPTDEDLKEHIKVVEARNRNVPTGKIRVGIVGYFVIFMLLGNMSAVKPEATQSYFFQATNVYEDHGKLTVYNDLNVRLPVALGTTKFKVYPKKKGYVIEPKDVTITVLGNECHYSAFLHYYFYGLRRKYSNRKDYECYKTNDYKIAAVRCPYRGHELSNDFYYNKAEPNQYCRRDIQYKYSSLFRGLKRNCYRGHKDHLLGPDKKKYGSVVTLRPIRRIVKLQVCYDGNCQILSYNMNSISGGRIGTMQFVAGGALGFECSLNGKYVWHKGELYPGTAPSTFGGVKAGVIGDVSSRDANYLKGPATDSCPEDLYTAKHFSTLINVWCKSITVTPGYDKFMMEIKSGTTHSLQYSMHAHIISDGEGLKTTTKNEIDGFLDLQFQMKGAAFAYYKSNIEISNVKIVKKGEKPIIGGEVMQELEVTYDCSEDGQLYVYIQPPDATDDLLFTCLNKKGKKDLKVILYESTTRICIEKACGTFHADPPKQGISQDKLLGHRTDWKPQDEESTFPKATVAGGALIVAVIAGISLLGYRRYSSSGKALKMA